MNNLVSGPILMKRGNFLDVIHDPNVQVAGTLTALTTIGGSLLHALPSFAALLAIIWYCVLLYDRATRDRARIKKADDIIQAKAEIAAAQVLEVAAAAKAENTV